MMCDELKYEKLGDMMPFYPRSTLVIRKQFVDEAIAELKAENEKIAESRKAWIYRWCHLDKDCKNLENELRATKRAMWMARAERAKNMQTSRVFLKDYLRKHKNSWLAKDKELSGDLFKEAFEIVEHKCRAKAEEYK